MRLVFDLCGPLDHAYVAFGEVRPVAATLPVEGVLDVRVDLDRDGRVVGIEFLEAFRRLGMGVPADPDGLDVLSDLSE